MKWKLNEAQQNHFVLINWVFLDTFPSAIIQLINCFKGFDILFVEKASIFDQISMARALMYVCHICMKWKEYFYIMT